MSSRLNSGKASITAEIQAGIRYSATKEPRSIRGNDFLGKEFLGGLNMMFRFPVIRRLAISKIEKLWPGGYGYSLARSRIGDEVFEQSILQDTRQIVNVGAGYCTRAIRYLELINRHSVKTIEVDHPATQAKKIRVVNKYSHPTKHQFVECDFEKSKLSNVLKSLVGPEASTLFVWEGVSMYLSKRDVEETLRYFGTFSNCKVLFDLCSEEYVSSSGKRGDSVGGRRLYETCMKKGEPLKFGINVGDLSGWLSSESFKIKNVWDSEKIETEFLTSQDGNLIHSCSKPLFVVLATIDKGR